MSVKTIMNSTWYLFLYFLPKNIVSVAVGKLVSIKFPAFVTIFLNKAFAKNFSINLDEAEHPIEQYKSLQEFFIRRLKAGLRPIPEQGDVVLSPCDGTLSVAGEIDDGLLIQAKGRNYSLRDLLRDDALAQIFMGGSYATIYLSPRDYHRFHMPMDGVLEKTFHIPGTLWPVNNWAIRNVKNLFCQNDRFISMIKNPANGKRLAHIAVGATLVGKIELDYCQCDHIKKNQSNARLIPHAPLALKKGKPLGKFMFGSTIILLFERGLADGLSQEVPNSVKMGEVIAKLK